MLIAKVIQFVVFGHLRVSEKQVSLSIRHHSHVHNKESILFYCSLDLLKYVTQQINFAIDGPHRQSWGEGVFVRV